LARGYALMLSGGKSESVKAVASALLLLVGLPGSVICVLSEAMKRSIADWFPGIFFVWCLHCFP
jgi:hypothetical protein